MKAYDIALLLLMLNASFNIVNAMGMFGDAALYYGQGIQESIQAIAPPSGQISTVELIISAIGLLIQSLVAIFLILGYTTILLPAMLWQVGLPAEINAPITLGVWVTYIIGYNQYKSGRTLLGVE